MRRKRPGGRMGLRTVAIEARCRFQEITKAIGRK